ncbi:Membrane protein involved in the export of O-antigen and teichoic acid [Methylobacterium gossipiicola]|uniref:Membrane protein involved in the export of O-antigen and teichoic acid n=1 Tax=Methylobacterium gossipiicola TaxID=582675 RepID=A0A1I2T722_9HYPH|nr:Membrane protein involved in the export of O-antigen and teichoic acid [Methylobacterium gossipiicola]
MLLSHTLRYLPAQLIGPASQFAAVVAWTHWLPPEEYGIVALVMALQELVFQLCLAWWSSYVLRYGAGLGADGRAGQAAHENAVLLISAGLQIAVTWVVLATGHLPLTPGFLAVAFGFTISRTLTTHLAERARAGGAIGVYTLAQTAGPVAGFALAAVLARAENSAAAVLMGFAVAHAAVLPVIWLRLPHTRTIRLDTGIVRVALAYSTPLLLSGIIAWASVNGIRVIVERLDGTEAVGLLSVGWGLGQRLLSVAAMLVTAAAFPLAVRRMEQAGPAEAYDQVARNGLFLLAVVVPSTAGVIWLTPALVDLFIGAEFQAATRMILPVAALAAAVRNVRVHCADQVFLLRETPGLLLKVTIVESVATLAGCTVGLVAGGLLGACLGCLAGSIVGFLAGFGAAYREGLRIPAWPVLRIAAATGLMLAALARMPPQPSAGLLVAAVAGAGGLYLAALALLFREAWPNRRRAA